MDEVLSITIRLIYQDYCRALDMQYDAHRRHGLMSVLLFRAEEIGYDDYARGNNQVPRLFNCQIGLRDAWLMGFAEAAIRDSVNQLRTSSQPSRQSREADVQG
ncbi:hypothetical protein [Janthinobacterium lividum]|jgi:hypothetical protein|uniref:hypothetical protein n=1 Tax=Janthinobacterium lividum TaxID=29581 RepID=UPI00087401C5|nr:hypothetical protein [Janthinobacterium lividum]MCC7716624.1 hypothetical protein [Janthinobacterium lividum]OEZ64488.1 hypothetical protein JANLI_06630 [Janthinobacterium lividum]WQE31967.1 hypothetical protein U0004_29170 [Janthinobacterium lividum]STS86240.1 Uncharacterised protein [Janthinobacterium lividum]